MSAETIKAIRLTCDGCGKSQIVEVDEEPPLGYHGSSVQRIHRGGGDGCSEWYACSDRCISKAVNNAIERESH